MNPESIYALTMGGSNPAFEYQFMVKGHNTNEKPIYYALYLEHGEDIPDKVRIKDDAIYMLTLCETGQYTTMLNSYEVPFYVGTIEGGSTEDIDTYFMIMGYVADINVSDTDFNADYSASTEGVIATSKPKISDVYGTVKVRIEASTKPIKVIDTPWMKTNFQEADYIEMTESKPISAIPAHHGASYELGFTRPTMSSGILASAQPGMESGFAIDYTYDTSTFNFYLGNEEYHFAYPHNDDDIVDGEDIINLEVTPDTVTINGTEFSLNHGSQAGSAPDFELKLGYAGPANISGTDCGYHTTAYPDYQGKIYYFNISYEATGGLLKSIQFKPLKSLNPKYPNMLFDEVNNIIT